MAAVASRGRTLLHCRSSTSSSSSSSPSNSSTLTASRVRRPSRRAEWIPDAGRRSLLLAGTVAGIVGVGNGGVASAAYEEGPGLVGDGGMVYDPGAALTSAQKVVGEAIINERFSPTEMSFQIPPAWRQLPGKMREEKEIIYTDTYGPVYRYTRRFPRIVDNVRRNTAVNGVSIVIARAPGNEETIEDLGTIEDIDAAKVFSIPVEGVGLSDVMAAKAEKTSKGLKYTWDLAIPDQSCERPICPYTEIVLVSATITGGGLYVFSVAANKDQWLSDESRIRGLRSSFNVESVNESSLDMSQRIYTSR